jgi:benzoate membrane transport protein
MGLTSIALSLRFRVPVLTAWSTPGAAMLITGAARRLDARGDRRLSRLGGLITVAGFSGHFERMMGRIPISIASGMLAGVLLRFGLDAFVARWQASSALVFPMFCAYLAGRRLLPRYAIVVTLLAGIGIAAAQGSAAPRRTAARTGSMPVFITPQFSLDRRWSASRCRSSSSPWPRRTFPAWPSSAPPAITTYRSRR